MSHQNSSSSMPGRVAPKDATAGDSTRKAHPLALGLEPHGRGRSPNWGNPAFAVGQRIPHDRASLLFGENGAQNPKIQALFEIEMRARSPLWPRLPVWSIEIIRYQGTSGARE